MHRLTTKLGNPDDALRRFQLQHTQHNILRMGSLEDERLMAGAFAGMAACVTQGPADAKAPSSATRSVRFAAQEPTPAQVSHGPTPRVVQPPHLLGDVQERQAALPLQSTAAVESSLADLSLHDDHSGESDSLDGSEGVYASDQSSEDDNALQRASDLLAYWQRQVPRGVCCLHVVGSMSCGRR